MGVQNLWVLLAPVGRQVEIESLAGQVLAVDASIWLTQFVKAMRDDEGNMIRNAHLLGTLHRVAKLLFYGVRPVFVFDGQTPEIKKRTTARRRKRAEHQAANLRHTAQRILLNRLKQQRQEMKNGAVSAVAEGVTLPGAESKEEETKSEENASEEKEETKSEEKEEKVWEAAAESADEGEDLTLDDIELDTSRLSKIDLHAVFSLPPHLQKDMIQKILRDRRQEVRDQFIPLAGNPEAYSHTQISAFLETSALNRRIEAAKKQKKSEEMQEQGGSGLGPGQRIDSNSSRFYVYQKGEEQKQSDDREDVVAELEQYDALERNSLTGSASPRKANATGTANEKRPLSEFAGGKTGFVPDSKAKAVTAEWVARQQVRLQQEPTLAIEKLRQQRLKKETPTETTGSGAHVELERPIGDVSISLKLEEIDADEMARFKQQFPGSVVEPSLVKEKESTDDEDVEWEEVPVTGDQEREDEALPHVAVAAPPEANETTVSKEVRSYSPNEAARKEVESEDEMEWEDVEPQDAPEHARDSRDAERQEKEPPSNSEERNAQLTDEEGTDELFLTLRNEMEDAKAHEDLDLLKDEALKSAMATASNLTQWAAGAVRRALQAHTQLHGPIESAKSPTTATSGIAIVSASKGTADSPVELSDDEHEGKASLSDEQVAPVITIDDESEREDEAAEPTEDERLQAALAASIADERESAAETGETRVRYLQYSQPAEAVPSNEEQSQPDVDPATLRQEQLELKKLRNRQLRDTEGITDDMVAEVMALLRLFGVPFLVSPMEAEAQCAALEQLGLVDGVITDDSDIFPFGGQKVYKNIFHHQKFVEAFTARDIERELGFSREQIIALALLLGSDYTDGVRGIGIVNASEIAAAYPGLEGLREFKDWVRSFDVAEEAQRLAASKKKKKLKAAESEEESDDGSVRERFQRSHASVRRKWELGDEFPSKQVVQAYMAPQVDRSEARFSWSAPDLAALRNYCANAFGWDQQKSDGVLKPLEEQAKAKEANSGRHVQTRLDSFFRSYDDQVHYAQIKSKRLRSAVNQRATGKSKKQRK